MTKAPSTDSYISCRAYIGRKAIEVQPVPPCEFHSEYEMQTHYRIVDVVIDKKGNAAFELHRIDHECVNTVPESCSSEHLLASIAWTKPALCLEWPSRFSVPVEDALAPPKERTNEKYWTQAYWRIFR